PQTVPNGLARSGAPERACFCAAFSYGLGPFLAYTARPMSETLEKLEQAGLAELAAAAAAAALEQWRIAYLGAKGRRKAALAAVKEVPQDQRREYGRRVNALKAAFEQAFSDRQSALGAASAGGGQAAGPRLDVTE